MVVKEFSEEPGVSLTDAFLIILHAIEAKEGVPEEARMGRPYPGTDLSTLSPTRRARGPNYIKAMGGELEHRYDS